MPPMEQDILLHRASGVHPHAPPAVGDSAWGFSIDLYATILHLMGMDHTELTYRFQGRDFRLTDVAGNVVNGLLV